MFFTAAGQMPGSLDIPCPGVPVASALPLKINAAAGSKMDLKLAHALTYWHDTFIMTIIQAIQTGWRQLGPTAF